MQAGGLVSKTEGWPEQLTLMVNLERNARASALHRLSLAGRRCRGCATSTVSLKPRAEARHSRISGS